MSRKKTLLVILASTILVLLVLSILLVFKRCSVHAQSVEATGGLPDLEAAQKLERVISSTSETMLYGLDASEYNVETAEISNGETFSKLLNGKYNVNIAVVNQLIELCNGKFNLRDLRAGRPYAAFMTEDTTSSLSYLVYEKSSTEFITFGIKDSIYVATQKKAVVTEEKYVESTIHGSLYASMEKVGVSPMLAVRLAGIFESTIDFHAIQEGDTFRVLFEEQFIDTTRIGIGSIYGAEITHNGKPYITVRFEQGDEVGYWDEKGGSMKKSFLRAPLSFIARVSSHFGMRVHPIKRVRRQHNGVDYAAPRGTPVLSIADGTVSRKYWDRLGGGNTLWVKHQQGLESGYLHLNGYASAVKPGARVRKGQVIAYVGTTGGSTGPHLDFRVKQNGRYINPEKLPIFPGEPIKAANKTAFNIMKTDVLKVMDEYHQQYANNK